ncbi:class I SAM-dependent methyltransferase [Actinobacteria bacterium IMCC26103]|nr:class I SAM-dependent methyltransferase [Actinobacteria bacterium IMCC26103]
MKLAKVVLARLGLLVQGFSKGVSVGWLGKSLNKIFVDGYTYLRTMYSEEQIKMLVLEGRQVWDEESSSNKNNVAAEHWNAESNLCVLLYALILLNGFKTVVETGVANGITTRVIMRALERTNGTLHSFDILESSRNVYTGKGNWKFHKLEPNRRIQHQLKKEANLIGPCDIWLHDSNHGQTWQSFEYSLAWNLLAPGGILLSDDVDASPAWGEASTRFLNQPAIVFDTRKFIGISFKN